MKISTFCELRNSLGEGLYFDSENNLVYWVDINQSKLYVQGVANGQRAEFNVPDYPSAVLSRTQRDLLMCNAMGLVSFNLDSAQTSLLSENPETGLDSQFRSNDGVMLENGFVVYGTMKHEPTARSGAVYVFDGTKTYATGISMAIPNSFIMLDAERILISDSHTSQVSLFAIDYQRKKLQFVSLWHDFSAKRCTPDGGCADDSGNVFLAMWDGAGIAVLDYSGKLQDIIRLPITRPTNCKLVGDSRLLVTTASEGMSPEELEDAPLSGSVLIVDL